MDEVDVGRRWMRVVVVVAAVALVANAIGAIAQRTPPGPALLRLASPVGLLFLGVAAAFTRPRSPLFFALLLLSAALSIVVVASVFFPPAS